MLNLRQQFHLIISILGQTGLNIFYFRIFDILNEIADILNAIF